MVDRRREVLAGAGVVTAWQQVRFARAAAPVQRDAGPALRGQGTLQTGDIGRIGGAGQPMQHQYQGRVDAVRAVPVEVEEVAVVEPQAFALPVQVGGLAPQRPPQGLQVRIAEAECRDEGFYRCW